MKNQTAYAVYPSLSGRTVVISGGASGIGEAMVEAFCAQNSRVWFIDRNEEAGRALARRLAGAPNPPIFIPCDLTNTPALQSVADRILSECGLVDTVINNAGNDTRHSIEQVTPEYWDRCLDVNLKHQFFLTQAFLPPMRSAGRGSIVNMSSIGWIIPSTSLAVYVTAKAAIVGLTRTLAHELGPSGIRVNSVLPGAILTERQRKLWLTEEYKSEVLRRQALKRLLLPEEVARLVLFLASDDSSAITNQSYVIDGGWV